MIIKRNNIKFIKFLHLLFLFMWIGGAIAINVVFFISHENTSEAYLTKFRILQIIDDYIIIPGAMATLLTGLIYSIWTKWGFFKHNWIIIKWVFTIAQILFGSFFLGPWLNSNAEILRREGINALQNEIFNTHIDRIAIGGSTQVVLLILIVALSVFKWFK